MADFAATNTRPVRVNGVGEKKGQYTLALPSSWTAAGVAWDLSASFSVITEASFSCQNASGNHAYKFGLTGTPVVAGDGHTAASNKLVAYQGDADSSTGAAALSAVPDNADLSAITALRVTVYGY